MFSDNIEELEKLLGVYRAREQAKDSSRDSEKRHLDMIREKNEKINELLKEI